MLKQNIPCIGVLLFHRASVLVLSTAQTKHSMDLGLSTPTEPPFSTCLTLVEAGTLQVCLYLEGSPGSLPGPTGEQEPELLSVPSAAALGHIQPNSISTLEQRHPVEMWPWGERVPD